MQPSTLLNKTLQLLEGKNIAEVSSETKLPYHWLRKLQKGEFKDPSVNRIESLYIFLSKKDLNI